MTGLPATPVSVVIPALNEERYLPRLLDSLLACGSRPLDIIVVDGQSEDRTLEVVETYRGTAQAPVTVRAITSKVRSVAYQRNLGAAAAREKTLLFLDADTVLPSPSELDALIERFIQGGHAAASCRFRPLERDPRAIVYYRLLFLFHKSLERWNPYALGACIVTTADVFRRCGGFDPSIQVNEDAHFCRAASRLGSFRILSASMGVSTRRFKKYGYLRMGAQYLWIFLDRTIRGEARDGRIRYDFGQYD